MQNPDIIATLKEITASLAEARVKLKKIEDEITASYPGFEPAGGDSVFAGIFDAEYPVLYCNAWSNWNVNPAVHIYIAILNDGSIHVYRSFDEFLRSTALIAINQKTANTT
jgi:hypothetical protein